MAGLIIVSRFPGSITGSAAYNAKAMSKFEPPKYPGVERPNQQVQEIQVGPIGGSPRALHKVEVGLPDMSIFSLYPVADHPDPYEDCQRINRQIKDKHNVDLNFCAASEKLTGMAAGPAPLINLGIRLPLGWRLIAGKLVKEEPAPENIPSKSTAEPSVGEAPPHPDEQYILNLATSTTVDPKLTGALTRPGVFNADGVQVRFFHRLSNKWIVIEERSGPDIDVSVFSIDGTKYFGATSLTGKSPSPGEVLGRDANLSSLKRALNLVLTKYSKQ